MIDPYGDVLLTNRSEMPLRSTIVVCAFKELLLPLVERVSCAKALHMLYILARDD